jgi:hypothetical protein
MADKSAMLAQAIRDLITMGFEIVATRGTAQLAWRAGHCRNAGQQGL